MKTLLISKYNLMKGHRSVLPIEWILLSIRFLSIVAPSEHNNNTFDSRDEI